MEDLGKKVEQIFDQFFIEERGNRLSQFSFSSFKNIIMAEIRNYKPKGNKEGNEKREAKVNLLKGVNMKDVGKLTSGRIEK